jgi:hypothetical protein
MSPGDEASFGSRQGRLGVPVTTAEANRSIDAGPGCLKRFRVSLRSSSSLDPRDCELPRTLGHPGPGGSRLFVVLLPSPAAKSGQPRLGSPTATTGRTPRQTRPDRLYQPPRQSASYG